MNEILDDAEIEKLTRPLKQGAARARLLQAMLQCPIQRRPDGSPVVTRGMLARLEGLEQKADAGINWTK